MNIDILVVVLLISLPWLGITLALLARMVRLERIIREHFAPYFRVPWW